MWISKKKYKEICDENEILRRAFRYSQIKSIPQVMCRDKEVDKEALTETMTGKESQCQRCQKELLERMDKLNDDYKGGFALAKEPSQRVYLNGAIGAMIEAIDLVLKWQKGDL